MRRIGTSLDDIYRAHQRRLARPNVVKPGGEKLLAALAQAKDNVDLAVVRGGVRYRQFIFGVDRFEDDGLWFGGDIENADFFELESAVVIKVRVGLAIEAYGGPGAGGIAYTEPNRPVTVLAQVVCNLDHIGPVETLFLTLLAVTGETDTGVFGNVSSVPLKAVVASADARAQQEARSVPILAIVARNFDGIGMIEQQRPSTVKAIIAASDSKGYADLGRPITLLAGITEADTAQRGELGRAVTAKVAITASDSLVSGPTVVQPMAFYICDDAASPGTLADARYDNVLTKDGGAPDYQVTFDGHLGVQWDTTGHVFAIPSNPCIDAAAHKCAIIGKVIFTAIGETATFSELWTMPGTGSGGLGLTVNLTVDAFGNHPRIQAHHDNGINARTVTANSFGDLSLDTEYDVAAWYDGSNLHVEVNGVGDVSASSVGSTEDTPGDLQLCGLPNSTVKYRNVGFWRDGSPLGTGIPDAGFRDYLRTHEWSDWGIHSMVSPCSGGGG